MRSARDSLAPLAGAILAGSVLLPGCVTKAKYADLEQRYLAEQQGRAETEKRARALDHQLRSLTSEYDELKVMVSMLEDELGVSVRLSDAVLFELGSTELSDEGRAVLRNVAQALAVEDRFMIRVVGHADSVPVGPNARFESNWELSTDRAAQVARFLQDEAGIPAYRLAIAGYSDQRPEAAQAAAGTGDNRRVDLVIAPFQADNRLAGRPAKVDVNSATAHQIAFVLGIDRKVADGIVQYRMRAGRVETPDELRNVEGMTEELLSRIRDRLLVGGSL